jgi:hypothetical protein
VAEIISLEEARDSIRADHDTLASFLDEQRSRLQGAVDELAALLRDPDRLHMAPAPELSGATKPDFLDTELAAEAAPEWEPAPDPAPAPELEPEPEPVADADEPPAALPGAPLPDGAPSTDDGVVTDGDPTAAIGGVTYTLPDEGDPASDPFAPPSIAENEDQAWARFVGEDDNPTGPVQDQPPSDDAYLAELRKAMRDDPSDPAGFDTAADEDRSSRSRFGRRR